MKLIWYFTLVDESERKDFEKLYVHHKEKIFSVCFGICGNYHDSEECTSEVFFYAAKNYDRIKSLDSHKLESYLYLTAKHITLNHIRKEKKNMNSLSLDEQTENIEDFNAYEVADIKLCLEGLSADDRELLYMRYVLELDCGTISGCFGINETAARKRLQYARERLRKLLERECENE